MATKKTQMQNKGPSPGSMVKGPGAITNYQIKVSSRSDSPGLGSVWDPGQNGFQPILIIALLIEVLCLESTNYNLGSEASAISFHKKLKHLDDSITIFQLLLSIRVLRSWHW